MEIINNVNLEKNNFIYSLQEKYLCQLIIGTDGINYYSNGVVNFNTCDIEFPGDSKKFMFQKYELDKLYLNFKANNNGYSLSADYFKTYNQKAYYFNGADFNIQLDQRTCEFTSSGMTRKELEEFYNQFESLYIVNTLGDLLYAKINGEIKLEKKDKPILPTEKEIKILDRQERQRKHLLRCAFNSKFKTKAHREEANRIRKIEEITNLKLFGSPSPLITSSNILIGVKNGVFELYWFNLYYKQIKHLSLGDLTIKETKELQESQNLVDYTIELAPIKIKCPNYEDEIANYKDFTECLTKKKTYHEGK